MDETDSSNRDLIDLVIQLCTLIGTIMEDVSPVALNATRDGLEARVAEVAFASRTITSLVDAAEMLLQGTI
jgi:hypothetical protein